eukprot:Clim_evm78s25 gene=Clim_evmTU78s25
MVTTRRQATKPVEAFELGDKKLSKKLHEGTNPEPAIEAYHNTGSTVHYEVLASLNDGLMKGALVLHTTSFFNSPLEVAAYASAAFSLALAVATEMSSALQRLVLQEHRYTEIRREYWEFDNYPEGEIKEMIAIYKGRGVQEKDAKSVLRTLQSYRDFFVEHMITLELGFIPRPKPTDFFLRAIACIVVNAAAATLPTVISTISALHSGMGTLDHTGVYFALAGVALLGAENSYRLRQTVALGVMYAVLTLLAPMALLHSLAAWFPARAN